MKLEEALIEVRKKNVMIRPKRCDCCLIIDDYGDLVKAVDGSQADVILGLAFEDDWEIV